MILANVLLAVAVLLVTAWLGRRAGPRAQLALWGSALLISAGMFLPLSGLRALMPASLLLSLESAVGALSWTLADLVHLVAFAWLAILLWTLRPDLRGWKTLASLAILAVAAELVQGLTAEREAGIADVGINLLGAGLGLVLVIAAPALWRIVRSRPVAED